MGPGAPWNVNLPTTFQFCRQGFWFSLKVCSPHLFSEDHQKHQQRPSLSQATWVAVYFAAISKLRFCFGCVYRERRDEEMDSGPGQTRILHSLLFISAMGTTRPTEKPSGAQKGCRESMRFPQTATRCLFSSTKSSALSAKDSPASLVSDSRPPPHACSQPFTADGFVVHSPIPSRRSF